MKPAAASSKAHPVPAKTRPSTRHTGVIHPVVIYPFRQPAQLADLDALYRLVAKLGEDKDRYARPLTVIDRKTHNANVANAAYHGFRLDVVAHCSDILDAWCVDTCQMWYSGLGSAYEQGRDGDIYWLIPGDFDYGSAEGKEVLGRLHDLPEIISELQQDLCVGEITTDQTNSKQLIDTYGTFALLYHWFPSEAREIRQFTERPRSEFLALRHEFLGAMLQERWYAYEQTVVMLLQAVFAGKRMSRFLVGHISDLPEGRDSLNSAMQQVERTERVLKSLWRQRNQENLNWPDQYRILESQSELIRRSAFIVLHNLLR